MISKSVIYVLKKKQRDTRRNMKFYVVGEALLVVRVTSKEMIPKGYTTRSRQCGNELRFSYFWKAIYFYNDIILR